MEDSNTCKCGRWKSILMTDCNVCLMQSQYSSSTSPKANKVALPEEYDWQEEACKNITEALGKQSEDIEKPKRYNKAGKLECWDVILDQQMNFLEGSVLKYLWRYKEKDGVKDLKKAIVYLEKIIQEEEKK